MSRGRAFALGLLVVVAGAGSWGLYYAGKLGAASALRLGGGLCAGLILLGLMPALWPKREGRSALEEALDAPPPAPPERPRSLRDTEAALRLACSREGGYELHYRLRPLLRRLAEHLLRSHRLVDLDRDPVTSRELLGEDLWQLVRPDASAPPQRGGRGIALSKLARWVERLESL